MYLPRGEGTTGFRPVVVFVYGGTWGSGDKNMCSLLATQLADMLNAVVLCPNYSIYPKVIICIHTFNRTFHSAATTTSLMCTYPKERIAQVSALSLCLCTGVCGVVGIKTCTACSHHNLLTRSMLL